MRGCHEGEDYEGGCMLGAGVCGGEGVPARVRVRTGVGIRVCSCIHDLKERVHHPVVALLGRQAQGRPAMCVLGVHLGGGRAARGGDARGLRGIGGEGGGRRSVGQGARGRRLG